MWSDPGQPAGMGILVALDVLIQPSEEGPRAMETTASALERLGWVGRPIILATGSVGGRRLPVEVEDRVAWARHALGDEDLLVVPFDTPAGDRHADDGEAVDRWRTLREAHHASWLIESGWPINPARRAGLTVIEVGGHTATVNERPDHEARDLLDAANRLLMTETFKAAERP